MEPHSVGSFRLSCSPPQARWTDQWGSCLVQSVSVHIGGDSEKKWRCKDCGHDYGAVEHPTVCGATKHVYNEEKSFEVILAAHDRYFAEWDGDSIFAPLTKERFRELAMNDDSLLLSIMDDQQIDYVYDECGCGCTEFEFVKCEGQLLDRVNGDYLRVWEELTTPCP